MDADLASAPAFNCGSNALVDAVTRLLMASGYPPERVCIERYGPTG
jgi:ferredoxin-NADP reductase